MDDSDSDTGSSHGDETLPSEEEEEVEEPVSYTHLTLPTNDLV